MKMTHLATFLVLLVALGTPSLAHRPSDAYLSLEWRGSTLEGRWDIALRDLEVAVGLDLDQDGEVTWGELRQRHPAVAAHALSRLRLWTSDGVCTLAAGEQAVERHGDGTYSVLHFQARCPKPTAQLELEYRLFFDLDPTHRGFLRVEQDEGAESLVLSPDRSRHTLRAGTPSVWPQVAAFTEQGVWHIWLGFDHVLFLLALLLPSVLQRRDGQWRATQALRPALVQVLQVVTAFTLAHSLTLGLATLGWMTAPSRWVEAIIALSVALAALNNLYPLWREGWPMAFGFGLVHGFGFAGVLAELGLGGGGLLPPLLGFNLGVEVGQLALVALLWPLAYRFRSTDTYRRAFLRGGSWLITAIALLWFVDRILGLDRMPF